MNGPKDMNGEIMLTSQKNGFARNGQTAAGENLPVRSGATPARRPA